MTYLFTILSSPHENVKSLRAGTSILFTAFNFSSWSDAWHRVDTHIFVE